MGQGRRHCNRAPWVAASAKPQDAEWLALFLLQPWRSLDSVSGAKSRHHNSGGGLLGVTAREGRGPVRTSRPLDRTALDSNQPLGSRGNTTGCPWPVRRPVLSSACHVRPGTHLSAPCCGDGRDWLVQVACRTAPGAGRPLALGRWRQDVRRCSRPGEKTEGEHGTAGSSHGPDSGAVDVGSTPASMLKEKSVTGKCGSGSLCLPCLPAVPSRDRHSGTRPPSSPADPAQ